MNIFNNTLLFVAMLLACAAAPVDIKAGIIVTESETPIEIKGVEFTEITIDCDDFVMTLAMPGEISINKNPTLVNIKNVGIHGYVDENNSYRVWVHPESLVDTLIKSRIGIEKYLYNLVNVYVELTEIQALFPFTSSYGGYGSLRNKNVYARILHFNNVVTVLYQFSGLEVDENMTSYFMENLTVVPKL